MNRRETVAAVARKLRQFKQRDVSEMLDALIEVWCEELIQPEGYIRIEGLGKLYVEQQSMRTPGAVRDTMTYKRGGVPYTLKRYYFRFHPADSLRARLVAYRAEKRK